MSHANRFQQLLEVRPLTLIVLSLLLLSFISFPSNTSAHAYSASYTNIKMDTKKTEVVFSIDTLSILELIPKIDKNKDWILNQSEIKQENHHLEELITEGLTLDKGNKEQTPEIEKMEIEEKDHKEFLTIHMSFPAFSPGDTIVFNDGFYFNDTGTNYVNFISASYIDETSEAVLEGKNRTWTMLLTEVQQEQQSGDGQTVQSNPEQAQPVKTSTTSSWFSFLKLGMNHILSGYDHLLFLIALLLRKQTLKQYIGIVTAFTIAHSITLSLSVLDIVNLPSLFVESVIALSIIYVALENIFRKKIQFRWGITFAFGLIHGLGFADLLKEMALPKSQLAVALFSFNIGIEVIQIGIVLLCLPILFYLHKWKDSLKMIQYLSLIIVAAGLYFLINQLFF
ncbi:HupE/UreJ family protein [Peribacillus loiseleuriae]|uniref:HupE/UreJ family protein n=1 Tax=Peribacillus loiseleuriae TaxID=1679170 RepID=UPI003829B0D7